MRNKNYRPRRIGVLKRQLCTAPLGSRSFLAGGVRFVVIRLEQLHRSPWHDRRNCVLVHELRVAVAPQQHTEIIEPCDDALQLDAVDQEHRHRCLVLSNVVEECVLEVLRALCHVFSIGLFWQRVGGLLNKQPPEPACILLVVLIPHIVQAAVRDQRGRGEHV